MPEAGLLELLLLDDVPVLVDGEVLELLEGDEPVESVAPLPLVPDWLPLMPDDPLGVEDELPDVELPPVLEPVELSCEAWTCWARRRCWSMFGSRLAASCFNSEFLAVDCTRDTRA
ncbi:MAG: hypothetical protein K0S28_1163 [Paucimonas sp.]|nr:hypothetical protein [Paucimonas sp.]